MPATITHGAPTRAVFAVAYLLTLAVFFAGSFVPEARAWGFNVWAHFPLSLRLLFLIAGLTLGIGVRFLDRPGSAPRPAATSAAGRAGFALWSLAILLLAGCAFYGLRARTHFLGDGYLQLASLARDAPPVKLRDFGEMQVHIWVKSLLGGEGRAAALAAYRWISIAAGIAYVLSAVLLARLWFSDLRRRVLLVLGLATGGHMLLFFGYVENYSLFLLAAAVFTWTGMAAASERIHRGWIVLPLAAACYFHLLGVTLAPAAAYLLWRGSRPARAFSRLGAGAKGAAAAAALGVAALALYTLVGSSYFLRFAFVPWAENRFTIERYTLFSLKHLLDYMNLLLLLFPPLGLLLVLAMRRLRSLGQRPHLVFLVVLLAGAGLATFLLEAKLGMPRDWDLFSLPAVALAALFYVLLLEGTEDGRRSTGPALLAIALGVLSLLPRAVVQAVPEKSTDQFVHFIMLDPRKNRSGAYVLGQYFLELGDSATYEGIKARRAADYPEELLAHQAEKLFTAGKAEEALGIATRVVQLNPTYASGWLNLGRAATALQQYDSARGALEIADGLNPYSPPILNELALAYFRLGQWKAAIRTWQRSARIDSNQYHPHMGLARIYQSRGEEDHYLHQLHRAATRAGALPVFSRELGDRYLERQDYRRAGEAYQRALSLGADSAEIARIYLEHPSLLNRTR